VNLAKQRWALAVGTAVVTAALAGLAWWLLAGRNQGTAVGPGAGFAPAGPLGFLLEPGTEWRHATRDFDVQVTTNSLGLRGPEVVLPRPPDRYRVLALGDSFSFGWGVELDDAWPARMARELQATGERSMEVVVAGVPGWSPLQQFVFLEQRGLALQPDLVLWQLCTNDLLEMQRLEVELDARRLPVAVAAEPPLSAGLREDWLVLFERLDAGEQERVLAEYRAGRIDPVLREIARTADAARQRLAGAAPGGVVSGLSVEEVLRGLRSGPDFGVRYIDHMVSAARAVCAERGIELRLMLAQGRPKARDAGEPDDGLAALRAWAARQSPGVLDTADLLPDARVEEYYFGKDPHWTPAAHPLVAQAVARWLADDAGLGLVLVPER
jgi:lysophospholipase L1-like esterase